MTTARELAAVIRQRDDALEALRRTRTITKEQVEEALAAMLVAMVEHGIPPDLQEALTYGDGRGTLAPGALRKAALAAAKAFGLVVEE